MEGEEEELFEGEEEDLDDLDDEEGADDDGEPEAKKSENGLRRVARQATLNIQYETNLEANPKSSTVCQCKWPDNGERAAISIALNVFVSSSHSLRAYLQRWQFDVIG